MSAHGHLSDDALLDGLYGLRDGAAEYDMHLLECAICAERWNELRRKREILAQSVDRPSDFFAAQRSRIYERIEHPERKRLMWVPAVAMACLVAVGLWVYHPAAPSVSQRGSVTDSQLFSEAYSMDQSLEPSSAAPIHALFEDEN
jgi:hypothetical protein